MSSSKSKKILVVDEEYSFDDEQVEVVYKAVKRLRMGKEKYDKIGLMLFSYIFDENILQQIKARATLFEQVLVRHRMEEYVGKEVILNIAHLMYRRFPDKNWTNMAPTMLKLFYDDKIFDEQFVLDWADGKFKEFFERHCLYKEEDDERLKEEAAAFVDWLRDDSEEESEEESDDEDDDDSDEGE